MSSALESSTPESSALESPMPDSTTSGTTQTHAAEPISLLTTLYWLVFLTLILPFVAGLAVLAVSALSANDDSGVRMAQFAADPLLLAMTSFMSAILLLPFLQKALKTDNRSALVSELALNPVTSFWIITSILLSVSFVGLQNTISVALEVSQPEAMKTLLGGATSPTKLGILVLTVCFIGPIFEEVVFRGIIWRRLERANCHIVSIFLITGVAFSAIHFQYQQPILFVYLFVASCLFGAMRYFGKNLWYAITAHIAMNLAVTAANLYG